MEHLIVHLVSSALVATNPLSQLFHPIIHAFQWVLREIDGVVHSWGLAIILLTIIVRLILFPLTVRQFRSAQSMQQLQPKIKELQRKFKGDKKRLQEETMKLYQEYRVNPFASCLPLLAQLPIFICLYYAIRGTPEIKQAAFLIIPSLGHPWLPLFVFYIITQMVSTELMMQPETEAQQKWIMRAMPVMFIVILYKFPAGLMLYWVTTNLWTIGQQVIIRRTTPKRELQPSGPKPQGRFMKALMQAQNAQKDQTTGGDKAAGGGARRPASRPGGGRPAQKRPGGARPTGKGGQQGAGKRPNRPAGSGGTTGTSDGRKRRPAS